MFGKILVAIILIVFIIVVANNASNIANFLKNSNFFDFSFGISGTGNTKAPKSSGQSQDLPFAVAPGYKIKVAPTSSSVFQQGYTVNLQTEGQYQQPYQQYDQSIYNSQFQQGSFNSPEPY